MFDWGSIKGVPEGEIGGEEEAEEDGTKRLGRLERHGCVLRHTAGVKNFPPLFLGLVLAVSASAAPRRVVPSKVAPTFSSPANGYAIAFPSAPQHSDNTQQIGGLPLRLHIEAGRANGVAFIVVSSRYPRPLSAKALASQLDAIQSGMLAAGARVQVKIQKQEELQLGAARGREVRFSVQNGKALSRARVWVTPKGSFQLLTIGPVASMRAQEAATSRFLNSFRFLPAAGAR